MFANFEASDYTCICGRALSTDYSSYWERRRYEYDQLPRRAGVSTAFGMWRRETILKYKFDPFMKGGEDPDFQLRLGRGHKYGACSAVFYYQPPAGPKYFIKEGWDMARLAWKHGLFKLRFWPPLLTFYRLGICLLRGKPKLIPYIVVESIFMGIGMVKGFIEIIKNPEDRPKPSFRFSI